MNPVKSLGEKRARLGYRSLLHTTAGYVCWDHTVSRSKIFITVVLPPYDPWFRRACANATKAASPRFRGHL